MTVSISFHGWKFLVNVEETKKSYMSESIEGAESCDCYSCQNIVAQREREYPKELCDFLESVGVNPLKEAEVWAAISLENGFYLYSGWWHFIGEVEEEGETPVALDGNESGESNSWLIEIVPGKTYVKNKNLPESPIIQIEYCAHFPWVLEGEYRP